MTAIGIVLLLGGALIFALSFVIPESVAGKGEDSRKAEEKVDRIIRDREDEIKNRIREIVDETREQAEEDTKRELERISNEKIMAVNDYSKVVMDDIEKNHKEVMFLYDMLDHKSADLKNTIRKADSVSRVQKSSAPQSNAVLQEQQVNLTRVSGMDRLRGKTASTAAAPAQAAPVKTEMQAEALRKTVKPAAVPVQKKPEAEIPGDLGEKIIGVTENAVDIDEKPNAPKEQEMTAVPAEIVQVESAAEKAAEEREESPLVNRNEKVRAMHRDGKTNVEIAKSLGMGVGEVNLIIDLYESDQEDLA